MTKRPCWVEIRTKAFEENFRLLASLAAPHAELVAVVKAEAYGHSLALCAPAAVRAGAHWLAVTSTEEAVAARLLCPEPLIYAIGGAFAGQGRLIVEHRLTPAVWTQEQCDELEEAAHAAHLAPGSLAVHLEIDTGMSRQGVFPAEIAPLLARFTPTSPLRLEGVMTHLYAADEGDGRVTEAQLARIDDALKRVTAFGLYPDLLSAGSSAALVGGLAERLARLASSHGMKLLMRPGLALYGVPPRFDPPMAEPPASFTIASQRLEPVLAWKTRVICTRTIPAGATAGYNGTFVAARPTQIALISAGYADGLDRHLGGGRFDVLVRERRARIVGRVCMDHAFLDTTEIPGVQAGDEVVLLGTQGSETVSAQDHADATGTIPWEVFTRIGPRVDRLAV